MAGRALRLRLRVRRNGLPESRIAFVFPTDDDATVYRLLENVSQALPLESDDWGLEDYVVELQSPDGTTFECLHFQLVTDLFDRDDEVLIRPLSSAERKRRRIGGRSQISTDGKHLLDGVPYGRPLLKRPRNRPSVQISPRKKRRLNPGVETASTPTSSYELYRYPGSQMFVIRKREEKDDDADDYAEYTSDPEADGESDSEASDIESTVGADELQLLKEDALDFRDSDRAVRKVRFSRLIQDSDAMNSRAAKSPARNSHVDNGSTSESESAESDSDEDDSDSDSDFENGGESENSSTESCSDDQDNDDNSESSDDNQQASDAVRHHKRPVLKKSKGPSVESTANVPNLASAQVTPATAETPCAMEVLSTSQGKVRTKKRNARRRAKRAMERSKLTETAGNKSAAGDIATTMAPSEIASPKTSRPVPDATCTLLGASTVKNVSTHGVSETPNVKSRLVLDVDASRRMLLSALGKRNSKRDVKESRSKKSSDQDSPSALLTTSETVLSSAKPEDCRTSTQQKADLPDWRDRITYRAVECFDYNVELSEPPFPFVQRWEKGPQAKRKRAKTHAKEPTSDVQELEHDADISGIPDSKISALDGSHESSGTEKDARNTSSADTTPKAFERPSIPLDALSLPELHASELSVGMIILWKHFALSQKTNWQPEIVDSVGLVKEVKDDGQSLLVLLSQQDREFEEEERLYDEETGERVYGRFEGPDIDEEEEVDSADAGLRWLQFADLIDPRIVKSP